MRALSELSEAKNPDIAGSVAAMERAEKLARETAIATNTAIIIMRDDRLVRVSAEELRAEMQAKTAMK